MAGAWAVVFTASVRPDEPCYCEAPAGMVWGAADITLDGGATREYRLIIKAQDDGLPYTVRVDKDKYDRMTRNLGVNWPEGRK